MLCLQYYAAAGTNDLAPCLDNFGSGRHRPALVPAGRAMKLFCWNINALVGAGRFGATPQQRDRRRMASHAAVVPHAACRSRPPCPTSSTRTAPSSHSLRRNCRRTLWPCRCVAGPGAARSGRVRGGCSGGCMFAGPTAGGMHRATPAMRKFTGDQAYGQQADTGVCVRGWLAVILGVQPEQAGVQWWVAWPLALGPFTPATTAAPLEMAGRCPPACAMPVPRASSPPPAARLA